jgi:hypothetical protein
VRQKNKKPAQSNDGKVVMTVQERKRVQREPRRQLNGRPARMSVDGTSELDCSVIDVAPGGVKIVTEAEIDVGDRFALELVPTHPRRQQCEVVWRRGNTFGVKFVG